NSGFGARSDGATPICNRRATSDDVTNFSSIDYKTKSNNNKPHTAKKTRHVRLPIIQSGLY
ncbi:MAG: palindromic element RPE2 domain-containing protein, partial [Candidatus Tisiphia sp.]